MRGKAESPAGNLTRDHGKAEPEVPEESLDIIEEKKTSESGSQPDNSQPPAKLPTTPDELEMAMFVAFMEQKHDDAEKMFEALMAAQPDASKRKGHEVWHAYLQYAYGKETSGLNELVRLSKEAETRSQASYYLGVLYDRLKEFDKAIDAYKTSVEGASPDIKPSRIVSLAKAHANAGQAEIAVSILTSALEQASESKEKALIYQGIAAVFELQKDHEMRALALELALECNPHDGDLRFKAAYSYSESGLRDLAVFHYTAQLAAKPDAAGALNNLGVEYGNFGMPLSAVRYYRRAFKHESTLAGSNLANLFMNAGFHEEAKRILDEAKTAKDPDPNVGSSIAALSQKNQTEEENTKKILDRALREQRFIKAFGVSRFTKSDDCFAGNWKNMSGETFRIVRDGTKMVAEWTHGKSKKELSGTVVNRTAKITLKITSQPNPLFELPKHLTGYAHTSSHGQGLQWMLFDDRIPEFAEFTRVADI